MDKAEEVQVESVSSVEVKEEEEKLKEKEEEGEKGEGVVGDGEQSGPAEFLNKLNLKVMGMQVVCYLIILGKFLVQFLGNCEQME